jgi:hypothetical protein
MTGATAAHGAIANIGKGGAGRCQHGYRSHHRPTPRSHRTSYSAPTPLHAMCAFAHIMAS